MSRFFMFSLACLLSVMASTAQATVLSKYLTLDGPAHFSTPPSQGGGEDHLKDNSVSKFVDADASGPGYTTGDAIWGVLSIRDVLSSPTNVDQQVQSPEQIAIVFSAKIDSIAGGIINLVPINDVTKPYDLRNLLAGSSAAGHLNGDTVATILTTDQAFTAAQDPQNFTTANFTANFASPIWSWELTADQVPGTDDFFQFEPGSRTNTGTDVGALTVTSAAFAGPGSFLPVDVADFNNVIHFGGLTLDQGNVTPASSVQQSHGWTFTDQSDLYINAVPEPGSIAVFGLLGAAAFARARRRNKK